jgi:hypothetical protein
LVGQHPVAWLLCSLVRLIGQVEEASGCWLGRKREFDPDVRIRQRPRVCRQHGQVTCDLVTNGRQGGRVLHNVCDNGQVDSINSGWVPTEARASSRRADSCTIRCFDDTTCRRSRCNCIQLLYGRVSKLVALSRTATAIVPCTTCPHAAGSGAMRMRSMRYCRCRIPLEMVVK